MSRWIAHQTGLTGALADDASASTGGTTRVLRRAHEAASAWTAGLIHADRPFSAVVALRSTRTTAARASRDVALAPLIRSAPFTRGGAVVDLPAATAGRVPETATGGSTHTAVHAGPIGKAELRPTFLLGAFVLTGTACAVRAAARRATDSTGVRASSSGTAHARASICSATARPCARVVIHFGRPATGNEQSNDQAQSRAPPEPPRVYQSPSASGHDLAYGTSARAPANSRAHRTGARRCARFIFTC
jgi:hypothetical protein